MATQYATYTDAYTHEILTPLGEYASCHDIDAIADDVLTTTGEGVSYRWTVRPELDNDDFWAIVEQHQRPGSITDLLEQADRILE